MQCAYANFHLPRRQDKKAEAGRINFVMVKDVGNAYIDRTIEEDGLIRFLEAELKQQ